jgi:phosphatidylglycerol---prolipoprotein diacylglyceryl transferase
MLPILFTVPTPWGPQPIYSYGVLLGLSLIAGFQIAVRVGSQKDGLDENLLGNAALVAAVTGVLGARILYVLENRELLAESHTNWFDVTSGGVTAYGGFMGGLIGVALFVAWKRVPLTAVGDAAAPALAAGTVLTRIGCYLYGCDFGSPLSVNSAGWLKKLGTFPHWHYDKLRVYGSPAFLHHVDRYGLSRDAAASLPVHPTQLYEALAALVLLGLSLFLLQKRSFRGQVILVTAMGYGVFRFLIEYLRDDPERGQAFGFSSAQLISLALVPLCAFGYSVLNAQARRARWTELE